MIRQYIEQQQTPHWTTSPFALTSSSWRTRFYALIDKKHRASNSYKY
jgi:hypothetical protein